MGCPSQELEGAVTQRMDNMRLSLSDIHNLRMGKLNHHLIMHMKIHTPVNTEALTNNPVSQILWYSCITNLIC